VIDVQSVSATVRILRQDRIQTALALGLCLVVVLAQTLIPDYRRPVADAMQYAGTAAAVGEALFTDPGRVNALLGTYFGPVYPMFAGLAAAADGDLLSALECVSHDGAVCNLDGLTILFALQGVLAALTCFFLFLAAWRLAGDARVAWLTLAIILVSKTFANYASLILTESPTFFLVGLFTWLLARLLTDDTPGRGLLIGAGLALAGAALARPSYLYLIYFMVPVVALWRRSGRNGTWRAALVSTALFAGGAAALLGPWWLRNYLVFDLAAVSGGYGDRVLVERLAYNLMTWREWTVSFIYWLPDFGDSLATALFAEDLWKRLSWYHPDSFYMMGRGRFFADLRQMSGGQDSPLGFLLREYVGADLGKHLAVTLSLAMRGQWVGKYVGLVGFLTLPACIWILHRRGRAGRFLVFCLPPYFMLGLYAFVSVNVVRYNEPLIAVFALSGATVIVHLADRGRQRLRRTRERT